MSVSFDLHESFRSNAVTIIQFSSLLNYMRAIAACRSTASRLTSSSVKAYYESSVRHIGNPQPSKSDRLLEVVYLQYKIENISNPFPVTE